MAIRSLSTSLKNSLNNNEPYISAHLIKFEKPTINPNYSGISAKQGTDYAYITDAPYNIDFDDGSYSRLQQRQLEADDFNGVSPSTAVPNGVQTYFANKVLNVGTINEGIEAKASNLSLKLDTSALGSLVSTTCQFHASEALITPDVDLSEHGFTEGDTITFSGGSSNNGLSLRLDRFTSLGIEVTVVGGNWTTETGKLYNISLISEEISTLILGNGNVAYTNYINREVIIYRIFINPETNEVIGGLPDFTLDTYNQNGAVLLFKGIISNASINEDPTKTSSITWTLSSHWGDFVRVQNRLTHDETHRALDVNGFPDYNMLIRKEYATDFGFEHSDRSLNVIATYNRTETKTKLKKKKKNLGLSKKYTIETYDVQVPTDIDLKINMHAKNLPVIYGVQKVDAIPVFFDNLKDKPGQIYVNYAIGEGKLGGILDIVIDDKGMVCTDESDFNSRSSQNENGSIDMLCQGRQDKGDTLVGTDASEGVGLYTEHVYEYDQPVFKRGFGYVGINNEPHYTQRTRMLDAGGTGTTGILHEEAFAFRDPIDCTFVYHQGSASQRANDLLVSKASQNLFKIQQDFYEGQSYNYYTSNHRLLDTAYVCAEYLISEGEAQLPSIDFVVRGKEVECYNYDKSYEHNPRYTTQSSDNFVIGDTVTLMDGSLTISSTATIIDKFIYVDVDGVTHTRFRWDVNISDNVRDLKMVKGTYVWNMLPSDIMLASGTIPSELSADVNQYSTAANGNASIEFTTADLNAGYKAAVNAQDIYFRNGVEVSEQAALVSPWSPTNNYIPGTRLSFTGVTESGGTTTIDEVPGIETPDINEVEKVSLVNAVELPVESTPVTDNRYVGSNITVIRYDSNNVPYTQTREITKWLGTSTYAIAFVTPGWDPDYVPKSGDSFQIRSKKDLRVSLNPAMQLLDYLKSNRYGKGLSDEDIDLDTFKSAARDCDTRSDITVQISSDQSSPSEGDIYHFVNESNLHFRGTVAKVEPVSVDGTTLKEITFTDCTGKLLHRWNNYNSYVNGEILYTQSGLLKEAEGGQEPFPGDLNNVTSVTLNRVSGSGPTSLSLDIGANGKSADGNPIVKKRTTAGDLSGSGYSLYDSDNIKYWKYVGWDNNEQRNVTRHQFNQTIDTNNTVFDNINNMLRQFNGVLRYSNGKYQLNVKGAAETLVAEEKITESDIVGSIKLSDKGSKKTYNSVSASIIDPQAGFESRSISFFNSSYLREDNGIPKRGSFATPSITNYYNARVSIQQFLDESRNGLEAVLTIRPSGLNLLAGEIISIDYPRFGWENKLWRITNLNFLPTGLVTITVEEHSDNVYFVAPSDENAAQTLGRIGGSSAATFSTSSTPDAPSNLTASLNLDSAIELNWKHSETYNENTHSIAIYRNTINVRNKSLAASNAGSDSTSLIVSDVSELAEGMKVEGINTKTSVDSGDFDPGETYRILELGDNNWNTIAGTTDVVYAVGDLIVPAAGQTGSASETGKLRRLDQEVFIDSIDSNTNTVTLTIASSWSSGDTITFTAPQIRVEKGVTKYIDNLFGAAEEKTFYYWIRYEVTKISNSVTGSTTKIVFSNYHPNTTTGVTGKGKTPIYNIARAVNLTLSNSSSFLYAVNGLAIENGSHSSVTITALPVNTSGTVSYKFEVFDKDGNIINPLTQDSGSTTFTFNAPTHESDIANALNALPRSVRVTMTDTVGTDTFTATDTVSFVGTRVVENGIHGADGFTVVGTSTMHNFNADSTGAISGLTSFQNTFTVTQNGTTFGYDQNPDGNGDYDDNSYRYGTFSNITPANSVIPDNDNGTIRILATSGTFLTGTSVTQASFDLPIINNANGETVALFRFNLTKTMDGTPAETPRTVSLSADDLVFVYQASGTNYLPSNTVLTATALNTVNTPYYEFIKQGNPDITIQNGASNVYLYSPQTNYSDMPETLKVYLREGSNSGTILARDSITIGAVKPGVDAQDQKTVFIFKKNDDTLGYTTGAGADAQSYSNPTIGLEDGWSLQQQALDNDGDIIYMSQRVFTSDGLSPQANGWSEPVIVARRIDGTSVNIVGHISSIGQNEITFKFEKDAHPDTEPSYTTESVVVDNTTSESFTLDLESQGTNTFNNLLMYLSNKEVPVTFGSFVLNSSGDTGDDEPIFNQAFGDTEIGFGGVYNFPEDAEEWGGFAAGPSTSNYYPISLSSAGSLSFNAHIGNAQSILDGAFENPTAGDGVIAQDTGNLWVYDGTAWDNVGQIRGDAGADAINQKVVFVFKKNDNTLGFQANSGAGDQTYDEPTLGLEDEWSTSQPALTHDEDKVYMSQRLFTSDGSSPQETEWSDPVIVAQREDGNDGRGIDSIAKEGETVTITYDDSDTDEFTVNGVASVEKVDGQLTITYDDGDTSTINDGVGISTVDKSGSTVTVTYDNSTTDTFTVEDGVDAIQGSAEYVTVSNITKSSAGTYSADNLDITITFKRGSTTLATRRYRVSRDGDSWNTTVADRDDDYIPTNEARISVALVADGKSSTLTATYSHSTDSSVVTAPFTITTDAVGISSVAKDGETVTITYDDTTTDTFTVNGVSSVVKSGDALTITYDDGDTSTINDGVGISSVAKAGSTVTVTYDDDTTDTFTVEDGVDAIQGSAEYVTVSNVTKSGSGTYSADSLDIDITFKRGSTTLATRRYRVARDEDSWNTTVADRDDDYTPTNEARISVALVADGKSSTLTATYSHSADSSVVTAPFTITTDAVGISTVDKSGSTVTVTYDDSTTDTFTVNGVASASKTDGILTITYDSGATSTITDGAAGNGISSVTKSGETVTVTYDNTTTNTFTVEDGNPGVDAIQGSAEYVTVSNITKSSAGTYSVDQLDIDLTFKRGSTTLASRRYRVARDGDSWNTTVAARDDDRSPTNGDRITVSLEADGKQALLTGTYSHSTDSAVVTAPFTITTDAVGISSVSKDGETVTITYDDTTTDTFTVNGVSSAVKSGDALTITYDDGDTSTINDGSNGVGISSITKSGETVTVTYDNTTTNTFTVEDGNPGVDAIQGSAEYVSVSNVTKSGDGTYSADQLDIDITFKRGSTTLATRRYRVARSSDTWDTTVATRDDDYTPTNGGRITVSLAASGKNSTLTATYSHSNDSAVVTAPFTITTDAVGISTVSKDGETVTITYDDTTTDTFTVNGIDSVVKSGDELTITYDDGDTSTINDGSNGVGIDSITKSGTTVTVTYDDTSVNTFTVNDGDPGKDAINVFYSNEGHQVPVTYGGTETWTGSGGVLQVYDGTTLLTLNSNNQSSSPPPAAQAGSYKINITKVNGSTLTEPVMTGAGTTTATIGDFAGNLTQLTKYRLTVSIRALDGSTYIKLIDISITPSFQGAPGDGGVRGGSIFSFEHSETTDLSDSNVASFAGLTGFDIHSAQKAANAVINAAPDATIRPNDRVTLTDNSANVAATRIYEGDAETSASSILPTDWSSLVVEYVSGSMIVDGTLSASSLSTNTTITNNLKVGSSLVLNQSGKIYTTNKSNFADPDAGIFLGFDTNAGISAYKFDVGTSSQYLRWDGQNVGISGTVTLDSNSSVNGTSATVVSQAHKTAGGAATGNSRTHMNENGLVVVDGSGNVRVKIGNLGEL